MKRFVRLFLATLSLVTASAALGGDFIDTRLSFAFSDDNVLARAGETNPNSPDAKFGAGAQNTQFYDNFNTRFSGFETLSNLVLYKKASGFFEGLTTEAALHLLALERPSGGVELRDSSSYIRLAYRPPTFGPNDSFSITGFPVSADRFRLGYAYRISWGGSSVFTSRAAANGVPGVKLQFNKDLSSDRAMYVFAGMKTGLLLNDLIQEQETVYGGMAGAGVDLHRTLRLEANGGYFQKGLIPGLASQGIRAEVNSAGASAQLVYHVGLPVGTSIDLRLYRNDPDVYQRFFTPEIYDPGGPVSFAVSLEGSYLTQTLEDPDEFGTTVQQPAKAAALQARLKKNYLRAHILGLYRTLSFIQFDVPGFPPFRDFPDGTKLKPELFVALGADYHFPRAHLTPGIIIGVQQPASYSAAETGLGGNTPPESLIGTRTVVVRDVNLVSILPAGAAPELIFSAKGTFRWDLSDYVAGIGEVYYTRDTNRVTFRDDQSGVAEPTFEKPHQLGFNLVVQSRF